MAGKTSDLLKTSKGGGLAALLSGKLGKGMTGAIQGPQSGETDAEYKSRKKREMYEAQAAAKRKTSK